MEPQKTLESQFKKVEFDSEQYREEMLKQQIEILKGYVKIDGSVAVLSDLATKKSYFLIGQFGTFFSMKPDHHKTIDSIWEEEIYKRIHPDDLFQRHLLELEFYNFLSTKPTSEQLHYSTQCKIRALDQNNNYQTIIHQTRCLANSSKGGIWLALCVYKFNTYDPINNTIEGRIINNNSGEVIRVSSYLNCTNLLSKREIEILTSVEEGLLSKEIALKFNISIYTVNRHRQNILSKLKVNNSIEAVKTAKGLGLL